MGVHILRLTPYHRRRLRELDKEEKRRDPFLMRKAEDALNEIQERHDKEYKAAFEEFVRCCRAEPGKKYDVRTRKKVKKMAEKTLYVVKVKQSGRWRNTNWTRQGKAVSKRAASAALVRAMVAFPLHEFRISEVK